jgi:hypothetical protein
VPTPRLLGGGELFGVAAVSSTDIWAVGRTRGATTHRLIEHWNGKRWTVAQLSLAHDYGLSAVVALGADDVWAVGDAIERWNGSRWILVPGSETDYRSAIAATSPNDIWLATLNLNHWNGASWDVVEPTPLPYSSVDGRIEGISAVAGDVWMVGWMENQRGIYRGVMWHKSGTGLVRSFSKVFTRLWGVYDLSPTEAWAVGDRTIEHWDGRHWAVTFLPDNLVAVAAISSTDAWAVGTTADYGAEITAHWDGARWTMRVGSQHTHARTSNTILRRTLNAVAVLSDQDVWAVGSTLYKPPPGKIVGTFVPLVEHYGC